MEINQGSVDPADFGTVTSVSGSGGTTGLTLTGGPITTAGTLTLGGTLGVANGGTGTTTAFTPGSVVFAGASGGYSQDNANLFWDDTNNRLGIGTASPSYRLHIPQTSTVTSGTDTNLYSALTTTTSASTATHTSILGDLSARPASGNTLTAARAGYYQADNDGVGTVTSLYGINTFARNTVTGAVTTIYGNFSLSQNISSGSIGAAYGVYASVDNRSTGPITTSYGLRSNTTNDGGGTLTAAYGLYVTTTNTVSTIGTWYGIRIGAVSGNAPSARRPLYIDDTGNVYFAGGLGIGVSSPTARLHLPAGTATANTAPLKFTSGTLLTTAEAGAVEFLVDAFYGTITTGAARKTFAFLESPTFTGTVTAPTVVSTGVVRLKGYTVATLPAGTQGDMCFVTDALAPTFLAALVGGGAVVTKAFYDGTNWVAQ